MTYLESQVLIAWMKTLPPVVRDELHETIGDIEQWMKHCLLDDAVRPDFIRFMADAHYFVEKLKRRERTCSPI